MIRLHRLQLTCSGFWVDVRLMRANGLWLASADTSEGPSVGLGHMPEEALARALKPFGELVDELLVSVPDEFHWTRGAWK